MDKIFKLEDYIEDLLDEGNPDKMFTYLRGFYKGAKMQQSMKALGFAREKHEGYVRKGNGKPYIIHPLSIACYAAGIGINIDVFHAAFLLHDVPEDTGTPLSSLPVGDEVRNIVNLLTIKPSPSDTKWECKKHYYLGLLNDPGAVLGKGGDRYHNLSTMEGEMPLESIEKNIVETKYLLLPVMKIAKNRWPEYYDFINTYRHNIKVVCGLLARVHHINKDREKEIIEDMKNTPAIKDPSHSEKEETA